MKNSLQYMVLALLGAAAAGCTSALTQTDGGFFGGNTIVVAEPDARKQDAPVKKYAFSIRVGTYLDARNAVGPNKIGISTQNIIGMSGTELMVQPGVSAIVSNSMASRLAEAGFQPASADAQYELSGVIRTLNYDVKSRDEINIVIESALKEAATGKLIWSAVVVEKSDRFAGVSGNNKSDIANYLRAKVGLVASKTTEAISASLMASRPELFGMTPGIRPVSGVTVLQAPPASQPAAMPASAEAVLAAKAEPVAQVNGLLLVSGTPARAKIYVDAVYYGLTPLRLELAAGVHEIRASRNGYQPITEKVSVRKGETTELEINLAR